MDPLCAPELSLGLGVPEHSIRGLPVLCEAGAGDSDPKAPCNYSCNWAVPQTQLQPQRTALWASSPVPQLPHRPPTHTHTSSSLMDPEIQGREGAGPGTQDKWKLVLVILFFRTRMDMITNSSLSQALILLPHVTDPHFSSEEIAHAGPICPLDRWRNWGRCSDLPKVRSYLGSKIRWNSCHLTL